MLHNLLNHRTKDTVFMKGLKVIDELFNTSFQNLTKSGQVRGG